MTTGKLIPFDVVRQREDKRLVQRKEREDAVKRKLLPIVVLVCETYRVSTDDLLDAGNIHPTLVMARDIIRWLGYQRLHIGTTYLALALNQQRAGSGDMITRIRKKLDKSAEFRRQVACIEALYDAQVKK